MSSEKVRILIVDDNRNLRKLVRMTLSYLDAEIFEAINADEALQLLAKECPHIVILDVMMPGDIDGIEVCKKIKGSIEMEWMHVIMLSAKGQEKDIQKGLSALCDAYLVKPFSPLELIAEVEKGCNAEGVSAAILYENDNTLF